VFELKEAERTVAKIKVIGVGGAGSNAVNSLIASSILGVELIAVNTDIQHLDSSLAAIKVQIGCELTKGLGSGSDPAIGRQAAIDDKDALIASIEGADMIFITAGMGKGTGTGASPVIANIAKELGILTVAVVTKPFFYEGRERVLRAEEGINELRKHVDSLIIILNDKLLKPSDPSISMLKSLDIANDVLRNAIEGISDIILVPGYLNLDFADVRTIMKNAGTAIIGRGISKGQNAVIEAVKKAVSNPVLEDSLISEAKKVLVHIMSGSNLLMSEVEAISTYIHDAVHEDANIIKGIAINTDIEHEIRVTVIATGIDKTPATKLMTPIKTWQPNPEIVSLTEKILKKNIPLSQKDKDEKPLEQSHEIIEPPAEKKHVENTKSTSEDDYDIPTYLRKKSP
jgi:cell division protein FtsZ